MYNMYFGLELECIIDDPKHSVSIGSYHGGITLNDYWTAEYDGSLDANYTYSNDDRPKFPRCVEFVSTKFKLPNLDTILDNILDRNIYINKSCGAHIHFSVYKGSKKIDLRQKISLKTLQNIRIKIFKDIKDYLGSRFEDFLIQYDRHYAKRVDNYNSYAFDVEGGHSSRYYEFNLSNNDLKTIEYRAFNLMGIKNNKDIREMYRIAINTIYNIITKELNQSEAFVEYLAPINICVKENNKNIVSCETIHTPTLKKSTKNNTTVNIKIKKLMDTEELKCVILTQ